MAKSKKEQLLKYPGPSLAVVSLLTIIFSAGVAWATHAARLQRLEENHVKREELEEIKGLIKSLDDTANVKFEIIEKALSRIEKKIYN